MTGQFTDVPDSERNAPVASTGPSTRLSVALGIVAFLIWGGRADAEPKAVLELFTSQGCSSCPAADKLLGEFSENSDFIALSMPIDYWDYLGWKDTLADPKFSARQKAYSQARGDRDVFTPQVIVNGELHVLGSDRASIERAVEQTRSRAAMTLPVTMSMGDGQVKLAVADAKTDRTHGEVWLCAVKKSVPVQIGRGENRGRQITYHNVVRSMTKIGEWSGKSASWSVPVNSIAGEGNDAIVAFVQDGNRDRPGAMLGAAYTPLR
jgi:hypothetical protein